MPHRPDSEASAGQRGPALEHPVDHPMYPAQPAYRAPVSSYPAANNMWEAYPPAHEAPYASAPSHTMMEPLHMSKRSAHETLKYDDQFKRVKTEPVKSVTPQNLSTQIANTMNDNRTEHGSPDSVRESSSIASESSWASQGIRQGREPLKKRKKHLDVLRRNRCALPQRRDSAQSDDPNLLCQVSPVSSSSYANHENSEEHMIRRMPPTVQPSRSESYDMRETQALTESAKIGDTSEIGPHAVQAEAAQYQVAPRFPEVLHAILDQSDVEGPALQWLPHGHAWRVVQWDALRRKVLPQYFPQFCQEEEGKNDGSIDAFLWNVSAWGFEEITDGPDVGAYMHGARLFGRDYLDLSNQMECATPLPVGGSAKSLPESRPGSRQSDPSRSPGNATKLLSVPSLATSRSDASGENRRPDTPERYQQWRHLHQEEYPKNTPYHDTYHAGAYGWHYGANMHHRHEDPSMYGRHYHHPHHAHQPFSAFRSYPSPYDSRHPFRPHGDVSAPVPASPSAPGSIHSGRGGARLGVSKPHNHHQQQPDTRNERPSFPVSQRGKGSRAVPRAYRTPVARHSSPTEHYTDASPRVELYSSTTTVERKAETLPSPRQNKSKKMLLLARSSASGLARSKI